MHTTQFSFKKFLTQVTAVLMILMLMLTAVPVSPAYAAAVALDPWVNLSSSSPNNNNGTVNAGNLTVSAGTNRIFMVAVCAELNNANTLSQMDATLGGTALTQIATTGAINAQEHCWMGYLLNSQIPAGSNALAVQYNVSGNGDQITGVHVRWASYSGIDQTTPLVDSNANFNGAATVTFGQQIDFLLDGITVYAASNGGSPATMTMPAGFAQQLVTTTNGHSSFIASNTPAPHAANGSFAAGSTVAFAGTTSTRSAVVIASLRPAVPTTTVGDGVSPANKTVKGSDVNRAVSAFTLSTNLSTDTVTNLVVTGTNTANVAANGVKIYQDNGTTANEWDATDTLVGTASFAGATATFTGINLAVNTTSVQYIITYDLTAAPTNGQTLTAVVSGVTATLPVTNNDTTDATLTIDSVVPTVTNVSSPDGATTYGVGDTITVRIIFNENVTVTGTPQLTLETGAVDRVINYASGSGSNTLLFTYTVQAGDVSADLDYVSTTALALNGGTIRDTAGNNAVLTLFVPGTGTPGAGSLSVNEGLAIDGIVPTVTMDQAVGQADPATSQPINFTVVFSEPVSDFNDNADIILTGTAGTGTSGVFTTTTRTITGGPTTYNVAISGLTVAGTVTATVAPNAVIDAGGNGNTASTTTPPANDNTVTINGYTITASAGPGGTITPIGTINAVSGVSVSFASVPNATFLLSSVLVDGSSVGTINNYTVVVGTTNRTIAASFEGGWSAPTTGVNNGCNNSTNAFTSNNQYTTCGSGNSAVYSNFNLNIPAGSTINYVEVGLEGYTDGRNLNVSISENGGANFGNILSTTFAPEPATPNRTLRIGNRPGDDWQVPFSPASFSNANFRVQITGGSGGNNFNLDQLQVKVNYTLPHVTIN